MTDNKECFFIAPIGDEGSEARNRSNKVMKYIIEEAVSDYGYSVTRADQMDQPGSITNQVIQKTVDSELVIADLTGHNPNVFYELAVRHATGEPYIQLIKSNESIPFDISDLRTIKYGLDVDKADKAKEKIRGLLQSLEDGEPEFDNPISESAEMKSLRESTDPADQNLAELLNIMYKIDNKIENLERASDSNSISEESKAGEVSQSSLFKTLDEEEQRIYEIIYNFNKEQNEPVGKDHVIETAEHLGMTEKEVENMLRSLMMDGKIYEPNDDKYKII